MNALPIPFDVMRWLEAEAAREVEHSPFPPQDWAMPVDFGAAREEAKHQVGLYRDQERRFREATSRGHTPTLMCLLREALVCVREGGEVGPNLSTMLASLFLEEGHQPGAPPVPYMLISEMAGRSITR